MFNTAALYPSCKVWCFLALLFVRTLRRKKINKPTNIEEKCVSMIRPSIKKKLECCYLTDPPKSSLPKKFIRVFPILCFYYYKHVFTTKCFFFFEFLKKKSFFFLPSYLLLKLWIGKHQAN